MKKLLLISALLVLASGLFAASAVHAQTGGCTGAKCTYVPLEPLPGVDSSGLNFANYVSGMFRLFITLGALFSVLMMVIAGISYMISESGIEIDKAKKRMWAALYGLLLLTACWLILYTINPNLLRFDLFTTTLNKTAGKNTLPNTTNNSGSGNGTDSTIPRITINQGVYIGATRTYSSSGPEDITNAQHFIATCKSAGGEARKTDVGDTYITLSCEAQ